MSDQPWHELPRGVAEVLRPAVAEVADEMIEAVAAIPAYSRPIEGPFGQGVRAGVQEALRHFVAEIEAQGRVPRLDVYVTLGRGEMRAGRRLEALLSAYRAGARVAWRRFAAVGVAAGLPPETLYLLAESIFAYIDELSAESAEGYALEQSAAASEAELLRRRLVRLLVREPAPDAAMVEGAAVDAGWALPRLLAAAAIVPGAAADEIARLGSDVIVESIADVGCVLIPDPDAPGRRAALERVVIDAGVPAGLGPTVEWGQAALSFARARAALALAEHGREGLIVAREHAGELLLRCDPELAQELVAHRLGALHVLPEGSRARMTETLAAWLAEQGRPASVAARLRVHPQTVRYRLARLRELLGDALDDPEQRFWLDLALRAGGLSAPSAADGLSEWIATNRSG
jgi:hypothetical protein